MRKPACSRIGWKLACLLSCAVTLCGCGWRGLVSSSNTEEKLAAAAETEASPLRELLANDKWAIAVRLQADDPHAAFRWRHAVESHFVEPSQFQAHLKDADPVVRTNAAIMLARAIDASGEEVLAAAVEKWRSPDHFPESLTCAAAEAWGIVKVSQPQRLVTALAEAGPEFRTEAGVWQKNPRYWPRLHAELIRAAARYRHPVEDRQLAALLYSGEKHAAAANQDRDVQLALVESFAERELALPSAIRQFCLTSEHSEVRIAVIQAAAARVDRQSSLAAAELQKLLDQMLKDKDSKVRLAAIEAIAALEGHNEHIRWAETRLAHALQNDGPLVRAAIIQTLGTFGLFEPLAQHGDDESWQVRVAVAEGLKAFPNPQGLELAEKLADDSSTSVRATLVKTITPNWPLAHAAPIAFDVANHSGPQLRGEAMKALGERWPPAAKFEASGNEKDQLARLEALEKEWEDSSPSSLAHGDVHSRVRIKSVSAALDEANRLAELRQLFEELESDGLLEARRREILSELSRQSRYLPEQLDALAASGFQVNAHTRHEVLPQVCELFSIIERLESEKEIERRRAAARLVEQAQLKRVSEGCWRQIESSVLRDQDPLVWRSVLLAVDETPGIGEENIVTRLLYAATSHPVAEVRRRACECLGKHPAPMHAKVLLPAVQDPDDTVVRAAVVAIGKCGPVDDQEPLNKLLAHSDHRLRLLAAVSLSKLGSKSGVAALERLSVDQDLEVKTSAIQEMGELADPYFLPILMRHLDEKQLAVQRAVLTALPRVAGVDAVALGTSLAGDSPSTPDRITLWREWYARQNADKR